MSKRSAEYAIQGFLYQFNLSIYQVLTTEHDNVHIEGIIEDIDIHRGNCTTAIQCKYHETAERFNLSSVYEPILKIMHGWIKNNQSKFVLYAYYPHEHPGSKRDISVEEIKRILETKDKKLAKLVSNIPQEFNIDKFLSSFSFIHGEKFSTLEEKVKVELGKFFTDKETLEYVAYPNAINYIANKSIEKNDSKRFVNKEEFLEILQSKKQAIISRWTKELKSYSRILKARREALKENLNRNVRRRCFFFSQDCIESLQEGIRLNRKLARFGKLDDSRKRGHIVLCRCATLR